MNKIMKEFSKPQVALIKEWQETLIRELRATPYRTLDEDEFEQLARNLEFLSQVNQGSRG